MEAYTLSDDDDDLEGNTFDCSKYVESDLSKKKPILLYYPFGMPEYLGNGSHHRKVDVAERTTMAEKLVQTFQELQKSFSVDQLSKLDSNQLKSIERQTSKLLRDVDRALHPVPPITIWISLHELKTKYDSNLVRIEENITASDDKYLPVKLIRSRLTKYKRVRCQPCGEHNFLLGATDTVECDNCGHSIMRNEQPRCTICEDGSLVGTYVEIHDFENSCWYRGKLVDYNHGKVGKNAQTYKVEFENGKTRWGICMPSSDVRQFRSKEALPGPASAT